MDVGTLRALVRYSLTMAGVKVMHPKKLIGEGLSASLDFHMQGEVV